MRTQPLKKIKKGSILMGVIWTLFSSIFVVIGLWMTYSTLKQSMWEEVPCVVTELKIEANKNADPPFHPKVSYKYKFDNASYTGDQVSHGSDGTSEFEKLGKLLAQHRRKELNVCYVNSENPEEATLKKQPAAAVIMGIVFAAVGGFFVLIGIYIIRSSRKKSDPITSSKKGDLEGKSIMVPFFSIFALIGIATMFFFVKSAMNSKSAENWQKTPAKVIWSRVISVRGDDSTTYRPEIFYRYEFDGAKYRSNSYKRSRSSSSGISGKQKIVNAYPRGKKFTCYVNPEKPWQALVEPKMGLGWLWLLFPIPFLAVGVGGLIVTLRRKGAKPVTKRQKTGDQTPHQDIAQNTAQEEVVFSPGKTRILWFIGSIFLAAFWNGITSLFLKDVISGWVAGNPSWFPTLFLTPFVLIGIGFILHIPYRFLAIFNPAPVITLADANITIGTSLPITWEIPSGAHKIKRFRILLKGREEAEYRRGTDTKTARSTFYEHVIIDTQDPRESASGSAEITLPAHATNLMPSWEGDHNSIIWTLEIEGDIPLWPDVSESYDVEVLPSPLTIKA